MEYMIGKNNKQMIDRKNGVRVESYAIKKFKVGTASVAVGAMIFLGTFIPNSNEAHAKEMVEAPQITVDKLAHGDVQDNVQPTKQDGHVVEAVAQKVETTDKSEHKVETTVKNVVDAKSVAETKTAVDMSRLKASLQKIKTALQTYTLADKSVVRTTHEQMNVVESVLQRGAAQMDVDNMVATLDALSVTLRESHGYVDAANKIKESNKNVAKDVRDKKNELTKTISEAEVTNTVAKDVLRKQKIEDNARVNVELAVNKNEIAITDANTVMVNEKASKTQIENSITTLGATITNVYTALENAGIKNFSAVLSATEGYTYETTEKRHENGEFSTDLTGKSYRTLDNKSEYKLYVHGYQSENTDKPSGSNEVSSTGGRTDVPLSREEAQKISKEANMWLNKPRPTGKANGKATYGSGGAYEFLTTEIYGYAYEQGKHYVYVPNVKKRFSLSQEAKDAGYRIDNIDLLNLAPGLGYNEKTDTVEGYVSSSLQNGVYDMRYDVTIRKPDDTTGKYSFANLTAGWMGWQDTTPPVIEGSSKVVKIGDEVSHDLKYIDNYAMTKDDRANYQYRKEVTDPETNETHYEDNGSRVVAGSKTWEGALKGAYFTAQDGSRIRTMNGPQTVTAHTTLNGVYTGRETPISDIVPGLSYNPRSGLITGTATEAGIFTMAAQAKDYNNGTNAKNQDWNAYGQETHENITIAVTPKITVSNVEAYATSLPVTISNGANTAEITTPDGKITKMAVKNGKWVVVEGTTNPAVTIGAELGDASTTSPSQFNLSVTSDATQYVGVDNIVARATTDRVQAKLQREVVTVRDAQGQTHTATFNRATGKFQLPNEEAYVVTDNADGTTTLKERRVYTDLKADGDIDYIVYEFTRTWTSSSTATNLVDKVEEIRKNGEVKAVGDVTRTVTTVPKEQTATTDGVIVTVTYDSVSKTWSASDGSTVKATASNAGWSIETSSGFKGYVTYRSVTGVDVSSIQNAKPTGTSTSYTEEKGASVDLHKSPKANVGFTDEIDDKSDDAQSETITTKLTVVAPDGTIKVFDAAQAEETAYIQAQRVQADKAKLTSDAVRNLQNARNELGRLQELLDRQEQFVDDAQKALDNLKLKTISITAKELAEEKLQKAKEYRTELQTKLAEANTGLPGVEANVEATRQAAIQAQEAVETAREALKIAAKANMENPELKNYLLDKYGRYKVSVHSVDSNGIVTTPTIGGNDSGEITEDAVADTTYYIAVSAPERSSGIQGAQQTGNMVDKLAKGQPENTTLSEYKLIDPETQADVTTVTTNDGVYTIDSTTGNVTFTPNADFVGNAKPVKVSAIAKFPNEEGSEVSLKVSNTYTPTVYGLDNTDDTTIDNQGKVQHSITGLERFGRLNTTENTPDGTNVNMNTAVYTLDGADSAGAVVVKGQGKYTIDGSTGVVTFTPEPQFIGKTSGVRVNVSATALDVEGKTLTVTSSATYTPEVTPVTPTGEDVKTIDKQGKVQTGTPKFTEGDPIAPITITGEQPAKFIVNGQPTDEKEILATKDGKEIGKYKIDPLTGVVTFTPKPEFVGTVDGVTVQVKDKNGTPANGKYTPEVTPVTPTASPVESIDIQGQTQTGKPKFVEGDKLVPIDEHVKPVFDDGSVRKVVKGEGVYEVDDKGVVTFTPEKSFVGVTKGVSVKRVDTNGTPVTTTYTPTVAGVTPKGENVETIDNKGKTQYGTPTFEGGKTTINGEPKVVEIDKDVPPTFDDGTTTRVVDGEGTYTIDKNGVVTFKPEPEFVGRTKGIGVKRVDKNGTPVVARYTPTVRPVTEFVDKNGKEIPNNPKEDGSIEKREIPEYRFVETKKLPNGDTKHIYEKVKTSFKDKEGKEIPNNPTEEGAIEKRDIPKYRFVETKKLPNGDTEHIYEKVTTPTPSVEKPRGLIRDTEGNVIPGFEFDMLSPVLDIPEYEYVETVTENGVVKHIYKKVKKSPLQPNVQPTNNRATIWTDENGNPLKSSESGAKEPGTIPGYEYVKTVTDPAGTIKHIFRKVEMPTPVEPSQPAQPVEPATPAMPEQPAQPQVPATPAQPVPATAMKEAEAKRELPNTGTEDNASLAALGLLGVLSGFGLVARKKKED